MGCCDWFPDQFIDDYNFNCYRVLGFCQEKTTKNSRNDNMGYRLAIYNVFTLKMVTII